MRTRYLLLATATAMLTFALAVPSTAYAASGGTTATITVEGGTLSMSVPTDAGNLGSQSNSVGGEIISGPLGQVEVSDARNAAAGSGWVASVISTAFTSTAGGAIPAGDVSYSAGAITQVGTATYTDDDPPDLTGVSPAVTATGITGDNSAAWNPTLTVAVPGGMAAGVYSGTITQSVL
jgi:hypothetical protein